MNHTARLDRIREQLAARSGQCVVVFAEEPAGGVEEVPAGLRMTTGEAHATAPIGGLTPEQKARISRYDTVIEVRHVPMDLSGRPIGSDEEPDLD
jgi:hypothetical protein